MLHRTHLLPMTKRVDPLQGQQWVRTVIIGQSFMLHQTHLLPMTKRVDPLQGQQWVRIVIIGQSFMLHQIRKMVGMAVAIMRGDAPANCITIALQPKRGVPTPMAPDIGLFLDECYFDAYNNRQVVCYFLSICYNVAYISM